MPISGVDAYVLAFKNSSVKDPIWAAFAALSRHIWRPAVDRLGVEKNSAEDFENRGVAKFGDFFFEYSD